MMFNVQVVIFVFTILVSCASLDPTCFPGCKNTNSWSSCLPDHSKPPSNPHLPPMKGACILCPMQLQQQPVLNKNSSSQSNTTCLPNNDHLGVRGFSFGILSFEKLRPPPQWKVGVNQLAFIESGVTDLEQGLLAEFPGLHTLYLDFNNLTHVKRSWFGDEHYQTWRYFFLSLTHNYITKMDSNCFQNLPFLSTLLLDSNSLQSVQPSWFHNLKKLGKLSLKSNAIKFIPPQTFKSQSRLRDLDLSMNLLTCLSRETVEGPGELDVMSLGGNRLPSLHTLVMTWRLVHRYIYPNILGEFAVRVNEVLFCITKVCRMGQFYHVQMQHDIHTQAARPSAEPERQCTFLQLHTPSQTKYSLPLIIISVNNTESDKHARNITHLCQHAWENVSTVKVALRGDITLQIVPMSLDKSSSPQTVAVVLSDVISKENMTQEEMMNVTCLVNTWAEKYQVEHVFSTPLSSTPNATVCPEKTQATTPGGRMSEESALTTREPKLKATNLTLNHTTGTCSPCPNQTTSMRSPCPNGTVKERSPQVAIIIITSSMVTVIGVVLVELLVAYVIRRQHCWSRGNQQGHLAGAHATAPGQQYSEIPDEYYNQQNAATPTTPQTDNDYSQIPDEYYNYYNTIPDEYYNRYNTYPLRGPHNNKDYSQTVRFNIAAHEVVLPSSTRLGGKHPSYDTVPQVWRDPQNYQIPTRGRNTNIRSQRMPVARSSSEPRYMGLIGNYSKTMRAAAHVVVLPSSTRLGHKHPSYDTAPQVRRDPQNYQNVSTQLGDKHPSYDTAPQVRRDPQNYQNPVSTRLGGKHPSYDTAPQVWRYPQNYQNPVSTRLGVKHPSYDAAPQVRRDPQNYQNPVSTRLGGKHPSYDTVPQVRRDPQNYKIPAQGRNTNIRSQKMPLARSISDPGYMGLIGN
ncbi:PREDICTED: uncharacterized protein LOC109463768 [Branchiostoma belcheri]|uniref:Uncharacterized protein LOC109463768 n=1 Tax=Branchiostoma belcheri TaxID=7741 RepID=A0A6P4XVQ8_BRABE|nr:PREDICTED: uncharacterized protein LOC109463768 [Branchiostoma belcheri]